MAELVLQILRFYSITEALYHAFIMQSIYEVLRSKETNIFCGQVDHSFYMKYIQKWHI